MRRGMEAVESREVRRMNIESHTGHIGQGTLMKTTATQYPIWPMRAPGEDRPIEALSDLELIQRVLAPCAGAIGHIRSILSRTAESLTAQDRHGPVAIAFGHEIGVVTTNGTHGMTGTKAFAVAAHAQSLPAAQGIGMVLNSFPLIHSRDLLSEGFGSVRAAQILADGYLPTVLHELAHAMATPDTQKALPKPEAEKAAASFAQDFAARCEVGAMGGPSGLGVHDHRFIRAAIHLAHRAHIAPARVFNSSRYGLSGIEVYAEALGDEAIKLAEASFADILAKPAPEPFLEIWRADYLAAARRQLDKAEGIAEADIECTLRVPAGIETASDMDIQAKAGIGARKFSLVAYFGAPIIVKGQSIVLDLTGMEDLDKARPVMLEGEPRSRIGHTTSARVDGEQLLLSGVVSGASQAASEVVQEADAGFPWSCAVSARISRIQTVPDHGTITVNGRTCQGPLTIARKSSLTMVMLTPIGPDDSCRVNFTK